MATVETIANTLRVSRIISIGDSSLEAPPAFGLCRPSHDTPHRRAPMPSLKNNSAPPVAPDSRQAPYNERSLCQMHSTQRPSAGRVPCNAPLLGASHSRYALFEPCQPTHHALTARKAAANRRFERRKRQFSTTYRTFEGSGTPTWSQNETFDVETCDLRPGGSRARNLCRGNRAIAL